MEMLLVSVAACTAADVISILEKKRQNVSDYKIEISGERREEYPQAFVKFTSTISCMDATFPNKPSRRQSSFRIRNIVRSPRQFDRRRKLRRVLKS
jgi:uncharacterized OsmC-like protein